MTLHLRVWRRVRLFPGCTMNISKRGVSSFSFGVRGAHYTVGRKSHRATIGLPGTGIFVTAVEPRAPSSHSSPGFGFWVFVVIIVGLALGMLASCTPVTWDRPMTTQAEFNMDKALCQLTAKGVTPDVGPSRPYYTLSGAAGAGIADGIMLGIERRENFLLCMQSRGYQARAQ